MNKRVFIKDDELAQYGEIQNLSQKAEALLSHQKENWDLLKDNFNSLNNVKTKRYEFDNFYVTTQFNPSRIKSASAKVDKNSIEHRACFLCEENLPDVQKGISYNDKYTILCNPYPIFKQHLTISHHKHIPQNIENSFSDLLNLSCDLSDNFFCFYNGPKCGASAPDHMHFQAGLKNSIPLGKYYRYLTIKNSIKLSEQVLVGIVDEQVYNFILIQSNDINKIDTVFTNIYDNLKIITSTKEEPLFNIISLHENGKWYVFIIPRKKHRPNQFFLEGNSKILVSPASVDMAGLLITPKEKDFEKLTKPEIIDIYNQVSFEGDLSSVLNNIL